MKRRCKNLVSLLLTAALLAGAGLIAFADCNHSVTAFSDNGDGTHSQKCVLCSETLGTSAHRPGSVLSANDDVHVTECPDCGAHFARPHDENGAGILQGGTCTAKGTVTYTCSVCGLEIRTEETELDPTNHVNTVNTPETDGNCVSHGYTAGVFCSDCQTYVSGHEEKPFGEHAWSEIEKVKATCTKEGYILYGCAVKSCGEVKRVTLDIDPDAHVFKVTVYPPTCTDEGYTSYACTLCRYGYADEIRPALGHSFGAPVWYWDGPAKAAAAFCCERCDDMQMLDAAVTAEIVKEPTETGDGLVIYTATVEFMGERYADVTEKTLTAAEENLCRWCGEVHKGSFWQRIVGFFHDILYYFSHLFEMR